MLTRSRKEGAASQDVLPPLSRRDKRAMMLLLFRLGHSASECRDLLQAALGDEAPSQSVVYDWFSHFQSSALSLDDDDHKGRPNLANVPTAVAATRRCLDKDRRITTRELARHVRVSDGSIVSILHDHFGMRKLCTRWVPYQLTAKHRTTRL